MKIYYFTPNCDDDLLAAVPVMTKDECDYESKNNNEVYSYSAQEFEKAFNDEFISDLGYIRIF